MNLTQTQVRTIDANLQINSLTATSLYGFFLIRESIDNELFLPKVLQNSENVLNHINCIYII